MKHAGLKCLAAQVLACAILSAAVPAAADDDCLTQGEFALALAEKVRLAAASEAAAVRDLSDMGITPAAGWDPPVTLDEKSFSEIDRTVIAAFAEGKLAGGSPSSARAVLAGISMSGACRQRYFAATPVPRTPDIQAVPLPLDDAGSAAVLEHKVPDQQRITPGSDPAAVPIPVEETPAPGLKDPEPGEKPAPISPFEPWDGPTRPGPGVK